MPLPLNGRNGLLYIRDRKANDFPSLCQIFEVPEYYGIWIRNILSQLVDAGLLSDRGDGKYEVTENWVVIGRLLDISLTQLNQLGPKSLVVDPIFGRPDQLDNPLDLFVLMPFHETLKPVWEDHIRKVARGLGFSIDRADNFFTSHAVMSNIWNAIHGARAIIADCTRRNPNVFYEIGLSHAIGKTVVLIAQKKSDIPFDLQHLQYIIYKNTEEGMQIFEEKLSQMLKEVLKQR